MYNLKVEAQKIIDQLKENGYESYFIGNYPFVKQHNYSNPNEKKKVKSIEIITIADLETIKSMFNVVSICDSFVNAVLVEVQVKQNKLRFKIFHTGDLNLATKKSFKTKTIDDILNSFGFLIETVMIDNSKTINFINKKCNAYESISSKTLIPNGNFREKLLENPMMILDLCYYSNLNYTINPSLLKIISNNKQSLKNLKLESIITAFNRIIMSNNPSHGLKIIKDYLIDFEYDSFKIFDFLSYIDDKYLVDMNLFGQNIDIISRWAYLLKEIPKDKQIELLTKLNISYKYKILWLIDNYNIINEEDFKITLYNSRKTLQSIKNEKINVFLLFDMFNKLTTLQQIFNPDINYQKIIDVICSRPLFPYQIAYSDDNIKKIVNNENINIEETKEKLILSILKRDKHPNEEEYLELLKECVVL